MIVDGGYHNVSGLVLHRICSADFFSLHSARARFGVPFASTEKHFETRDETTAGRYYVLKTTDVGPCRFPNALCYGTWVATDQLRMHAFATAVLPDMP